MHALKSLIQQKSKKNASGDHCPAPGSKRGPCALVHAREKVLASSSKKPRVRSSESTDVKFDIENFILTGSGSIPEDTTFSQDEIAFVNSFMSSLGLTELSDREAGYDRIKRCREAVMSKLNEDHRTTSGRPDRGSNGATCPKEAPITTAWENLESALASAIKLKKFYKWIRLTFSSWLFHLKKELDESSGFSGEFSTNRGSGVFAESCILMENLISDIESGALATDLSAHLEAVAEKALNGDFVGAENEYMRLSVGNQAWLIGVGNCFIQERSSLDRIREAKHIMNDERVRNYVQCIKRLITISERSILART